MTTRLLIAAVLIAAVVSAGAILAVLTGDPAVAVLGGVAGLLILGAIVVRLLGQIRAHGAASSRAVTALTSQLAELVAETRADAAESRAHAAELESLRSTVTSLESESRSARDLLLTIKGRVGGGASGLEERLRRSTAGDVSALLALRGLVDFHNDVPSPAGWAATPRTLLALVSAVARLRDGAVVLECGSGTSSVWLGLAALREDRGIRVISLEHDPDFAEQTRGDLERNGLASTVELRVAPLEEQVIGSETYRWYAAESIASLPEVDLLFVDGPPGSTGPSARYPAFPLLAGCLGDDALVVLDDTSRAEEREIVARWIDEAGAPGRLVLERDVDRATVLRYRL